MKYVEFKQGGAPEDLFIATTQAPSCSDHQVVIKVAAFGVNRADTLQRQGKYPAPPGESTILGLEAAGTIERIGKKVSQWQPGQRVFGLVPGGGYAEKVAAHEDHIMAVPQSLSFEQAAGIAEVFLTAYQSVCWHAQLKAKQRILIHAGASGVGLAAIQLAKRIGADVAVTASSADKLTQCERAGATLLINYRHEDFADVLARHWQGVDSVIDFVGGDYLNRNLKILKPDGQIVYLAMLAGRYVEQFDLALLLAKRATITGSTLRNRSDDYKARLISEFTSAMLPLFNNGTLQPVIDTVYPVSKVSHTHRRLEENATQGKLIVNWDS